MKTFIILTAFIAVAASKPAKTRIDVYEIRQRPLDDFDAENALSDSQSNKYFVVPSPIIEMSNSRSDSNSETEQRTLDNNNKPQENTVDNTSKNLLNHLKLWLQYATKKGVFVPQKDISPDSSSEKAKKFKDKTRSVELPPSDLAQFVKLVLSSRNSQKPAAPISGIRLEDGPINVRSPPAMEVRIFCILYLIVTVAAIVNSYDQDARKREAPRERDGRRASVARKGVHYHTKRDMSPVDEVRVDADVRELPDAVSTRPDRVRDHASSETQQEPRERARSEVRLDERSRDPNRPARDQTRTESNKRSTTRRPARDQRRKLYGPGHLPRLLDDDIDNDEISVAVGPPPFRSKYDRKYLAQLPAAPPKPSPVHNETFVVELVKNILHELSRDLLMKHVSEDYVFGQYVGNAMRNLTNENRLRMQHEILDLILKYQTGDAKRKAKDEDVKNVTEIKEIKHTHSNDTDENWPEFSNLAKFVG